ncbi:hypothetical protein LOK49_LG15G02623 [Camellia lanceoleosa]|uniref:Uncharacterized protein n=1 Tax=Camellia lanceoleosa TaxID=1840588 RepID=A0ACC0F169_9ERIC|nr:hypothetical protein LOK49_LG15G02623 [Camellia lanceoleosa]
MGSRLLLLLLASETVMQIEATICNAQSISFRGMCFVKRNCEIACEKDGFEAGGCHGIKRQCICTKPCFGGGGGSGSEGGGESGGGGRRRDGSGEGGGDKGGDGGDAPPVHVEE